MTEHPNAVTVRRSFEGWISGRLDVLGEYITDDAVLHFAGNNAMSGTYRGRDAVMAALGRASQGLDPHGELEAVLASDDHVLAFFHSTSEREGKTLDVVQAFSIKVNAEGKLTEAWFLANDQRRWDQFWP